MLRQLNRYGETILYLGYDVKTGKSVCLREFFTDSLMEREEDGSSTVKPGCGVKFKSLLMDYQFYLIAISNFLQIMQIHISNEIRLFCSDC